MLRLACGSPATAPITRQQAALQPPAVLGRPVAPTCCARQQRRRRQQDGLQQRARTARHVLAAASASDATPPDAADERGGAPVDEQPPAAAFLAQDAAEEDDDEYLEGEEEFEEEQEDAYDDDDDEEAEEEEDPTAAYGDLEEIEELDWDTANRAYADYCQQQYGRPGLIDFASGVNNLPKVTLSHPSGSSCELYLHGAAVTSWRHSDGRELLHLRDRNAFDGQDPITGGIQIAWPQYGAGPLPTHGFLQHLHWSVLDTSWREPHPDQLPDAVDAHTIDDWRPTIALYAESDDKWAKRWPHKFEAVYSVTLMQPNAPAKSDIEWMREAAETFQPWKQRQREEAAAATATAAAAARQRAGDRAAPAKLADEEEKMPLTPSVLRCLLQIHNSDEQPFTFTTGLRTHFATRDIPRNSKTVKTLGLRGKYVLDYTRNPLEPVLAVEDSHNVLFGDMAAQDRLFVDCEAQGDVLFCPGSPSHFEIRNADGFRDIGIAHPTNVAPDEARRFVCMSSARVARQVTLKPGEIWVGEMLITAHDEYWPLPPWEMDEPLGVPVPDPTPDNLQLRRNAMAE